MGRSRASHYRARRGPRCGPPAPRPPSKRKLAAAEAEQIIEVLNCERFCDRAPAEIWATLLDEGVYLASVSTFYRLLRQRHQVRERRRVARHLPHAKPELVATGPNQVWSWDITKLAGPYKWTWFQLYVILDVYSRYVVGWLVAARESAALAEASATRSPPASSPSMPTVARR
jgi:putative transposase